jgi:hypothetical protein
MSLFHSNEHFYKKRKEWFMRKLILISSILLVSASLAYGQDYVGPEKCLQCHNNPGLGDMTGWRASMHANGYSYVPDDSRSMEDLFGIVADADQNGIDDFKDGLDFNTISSVFDQYKPNAPILSYDAQNGYRITIGQVTHKVYMTYGGSGLYKQRYMVKINTGEGESEAYYLSPVQYNDVTRGYVTYHPETWWDSNNEPIYTPGSTLTDAAKGKSMASGCSGCHVTGLELNETAAGEWVARGASVDPTTLPLYADKNNIFDLDGDGDLDQINTTCERCHGPGSEHAAAPSKDNMINPETDLTAEQANNLCGMCHIRGKSKPNNTFGFPYDDANLTSWKVGDLVADIFTDGGGDWGDGKTSKKHRQQYLGFIESEKATSQFEEVSCFDCHDVHNEVKHHITEEVEEEDSQGNPITIATENDNNSLCLSCHATEGDFEDISKEMVADLANNREAIAAVVAKHTNHSYDPENLMATDGASRCSKCHMPKTAKSAIEYDINSHTFEAVSPAKTLAFEMPNSCAVSCHNKNPYTFGVDMSADVFKTWSEQTDKDLSEKLLFWYENQWFHETNEDNNIVNAIATGDPPALDGDFSDAAWAGVDFATVPLANDRSVDVMAVNTDSDLYLAFKWADATASFTRSGSWSFNGTTWDNSPGQNEDRIGLMWNMSVPDEEWNSRGCMSKCHRNVDNTNANQDSTTSEDDAFLPTGQKADMWHMKAARGLPAMAASGSNLTIDPATHEVTAGTVMMSGYMDDKFVGAYDKPPDGGRHGDAGSNTYSRNRNADKTGPKYIETDPTDFIDAMTLHQSEIDAGEAVEVSSLSGSDLQTAWGKYTALNAVVPERVLHAPEGSRGDIMQAAKWVDGFWYTEIKRALDTGNPDDDVIFTTPNSYTFGIALMDNAGGSGHWTQGKALTTLNLGTTGIADEPEEIPFSFDLAQNYPNPFNPETTIKFAVPEQGHVVLRLFNALGVEVQTLFEGEVTAGNYTLKLNGARLSSGIYFYRLEAAGKFVATKKMVLMK